MSPEPGKERKYLSGFRCHAGPTMLSLLRGRKTASGGQPHLKICKHLILLFALSFAGCITYYRPDPLSGIDPPRTNRGTSVGVAFNRYAATAYFDGRGSSPHPKTTERADRKYTRSDIIFSTFAR